MNYLVLVMTMKSGETKKEYHEFFNLEDAKDYADSTANYLCRVLPDFDFDISIYELTNY